MLDMPIRIIKRKKQKHLRVHAKSNHYLVTAPKRMSKRAIDAFIRENARAIKALPRTINPKDALYPSKTLTLFGVTKPLKVEKGSEDSLVLNPSQVVFKTRKKKDNTIAIALEDALNKILKKELQTIHASYRQAFPDLCDYEVFFKTRYMKSRFGSANPAKSTITINRVFAHYERHYLKYIYAHEISHFTHQNHSPQFYKSLNRLYPEYKIMRAKLRQAHKAFTTMSP
jgi:predicted metal-dependent hydrolase